MTTWKRVPWSAECERLQGVYTDEVPVYRSMSAYLATPLDLLPHQRAALEATPHIGRGAVLSVPAGGGKTLLARLVWEGLHRPRTLLLCPASLLDQIDPVLCADDRVTEVSYERLANPASEVSFEGDPQLILLDEAHRLSRDSVAYRLVARIQERYGCPVVAMTGTLMRRSVRDYAHLFALALGDRSPLPRNNREIDLWADALDENVSYINRAHLGALRDLLGSAARVECRSTLYKKMAAHPQVYLPATDEVSYGSGLRVGSLEPEYILADISFAMLKLDHGVDPDGNPILDNFARARLARTLPLGWVHRPRDLQREVYTARADWEHLVRRLMASGEALSEGRAARLSQVQTDPVYLRWKAVRAIYRRSERPVPLAPIEHLREWYRYLLEPYREGVAIWTQTPAIGVAVAEALDLPYYGADGEDLPTDGRGGVYSIQVHGTGKNLQAYDRALVLEPPTGPAQIEQLLARLYRQGQARKVCYDFFFHDTEKWQEWLQRARDDAKVVYGSVGGETPRILQAETQNR